MAGTRRCDSFYFYLQPLQEIVKWMEEEEEHGRVAAADSICIVVTWFYI
jgi:hypothetical protein